MIFLNLQKKCIFFNPQKCFCFQAGDNAGGAGRPQLLAGWPEDRGGHLGCPRPDLPRLRGDRPGERAAGGSGADCLLPRSHTHRHVLPQLEDAVAARALDIHDWGSLPIQYTNVNS